MVNLSKPLEPHPDAVKRSEELNELSDEIAELAANIEAATYRLLTLIREFDKRGYWDNGVARSCAHWLSWRIGMDLGAAREKVRVARALEHLPLISDALRQAKISYAKARAMTRVATPENEHKLLNIALHGTASHVERVVRAWRRIDGLQEREHANRQHERRYFRTYTDDDGMLVVKARLTPEVGAALLRALDAGREALYNQTRQKEKNVSAETSLDQADKPYELRQADAIGLVAESALNNGLDPGTRADRYMVVVHTEDKVLADPNQPGESVLEDGPTVSAETSRRISCDSSKVVFKLTKDGTLVDVGRKTRVVSTALRRALAARDKTCRFPGCNAKVCDSHHLTHWSEGGETDLSNLALLCRRHHRLVHEGGFKMKFLDNGELQFYWPGGQPLPRAPTLPAIGADPLLDIRARNDQEGIKVDSETLTPKWAGEPMDLDWVMRAAYGNRKRRYSRIDSHSTKEKFQYFGSTLDQTRRNIRESWQRRKGKPEKKWSVW